MHRGVLGRGGTSGTRGRGTLHKENSNVASATYAARAVAVLQRRVALFVVSGSNSLPRDISGKRVSLDRFRAAASIF